MARHAAKDRRTGEERRALRKTGCAQVYIKNKHDSSLLFITYLHFCYYERGYTSTTHSIRLPVSIFALLKYFLSSSSVTSMCLLVNTRTLLGSN